MIAQLEDILLRSKVFFLNIYMEDKRHHLIEC